MINIIYSIEYWHTHNLGAFKAVLDLKLPYSGLTIEIEPSTKFPFENEIEVESNNMKNEFIKSASRSPSIAYIEEAYENINSEHLFSLKRNSNKKSVDSIRLISKEEIEYLFEVEDVKYVPAELKKLQISQYPIQKWIEESEKVRCSIKKSQEYLMKNNKSTGKALLRKRSSSLKNSPRNSKFLREIIVKQEGKKILVQKVVPTNYTKIEDVSAKNDNPEVRIESEAIPFIQQVVTIELQNRITSDIQMNENTEADKIQDLPINDERTITQRELELLVPVSLVLQSQKINP